jgi:hypothetical protein
MGKDRKMSEVNRGTIWMVLALLLGIQAIRPARTNPAVVQGHRLEDAISLPAGVDSVLNRACSDCHSNLTRWPWYSNVAPVSWFVINHVDDGRRQMNFSEWQRPGVADPMEYARRRFHSACSEVRTGGMPLRSYLLVHRNARLSAEDVQTICDWADRGLSGDK